MTTDLEELRTLVHAEMDQMTAVATGGPAIDSVNRDYRRRRTRIRRLLRPLGLEDPNPHSDLWSWYGKWSREFSTYQGRREYICELFQPLLDAINGLELDSVGSGLPEAETTGWDSVDGQVGQLRVRLATCGTTEDAQAVGLLCRDIMISLAEASHDPTEHGEVGASAVDRLNAVIDFCASGGSRQRLRKLLKATVDYANKVQHSRTGSKREAGICAEATVAATQLIRRLVPRKEDDVRLETGDDIEDWLRSPPTPDDDDVPF